MKFNEILRNKPSFSIKQVGYYSFWCNQLSAISEIADTLLDLLENCSWEKNIIFDFSAEWDGGDSLSRWDNYFEKQSEVRGLNDVWSQKNLKVLFRDHAKVNLQIKIPFL